MASKSSVASTLEEIGEASGQPLLSDSGLRLCGGHVPRVTGAQPLAGMGVEITKNLVLARHSVETIMRHLVDAPLRSSRSDPGQPTPGTAMPLASGNSAASAALHSRARTLESVLTGLGNTFQEHAQDMTSFVPDVARPVQLVYVQSIDIVTIH